MQECKNASVQWFKLNVINKTVEEHLDFLLEIRQDEQLYKDDIDEIGEMDMNLQVKLLRVLEDRKIRRLDGNRNIDIDVRVVAATNLEIKEAIEQKNFREDLYYRLNVFPIHVAPLRDRR